MFTQFAAATAANGTNLPIKGGADCKIKQSKLMVIPNRLIIGSKVWTSSIIITQVENLGKILTRSWWNHGKIFDKILARPLVRSCKILDKILQEAAGSC